MKKIVSLILAVALIAALAVSASATVVVHDQTAWETQNQIEHGYCADWNITPGVWAGDLVRLTADLVKVNSITAGTKQTWTKCDQALTIKEAKALCDGQTIKNLTVFRQRNVTNEAGCPIDIDVTLWSCNPSRKSNQSVVVLFRAEGTCDWQIVDATVVDKEGKRVTATLPGNGAYVVALAW